MGSCQASEAGAFKVDAESSERGEAPSRSVAARGVILPPGLGGCAKSTLECVSVVHESLNTIRMCGEAANLMQTPWSTVGSCQASEAGAFKVDAESSERGEPPSRSVAARGVVLPPGLRVCAKSTLECASVVRESLNTIRVCGEAANMMQTP